jgi:hypothetical protein
MPGFRHPEPFNPTPDAAPHGRAAGGPYLPTLNAEQWERGR